MFIANDFEKFCDNLEIPKSIKDTVSSRLKKIVRRINLEYWGNDSETTHYMVAGSYGRNTAIATSDIDVIVELPWKEYFRFDEYTWNGQSALLQDVKEKLRKTYPTSEISGDGQVVDIDFSNGIKFEVVPAFKYENGQYLYADTNHGGSWKEMNPSQENLMFMYCNLIKKGNLVRLCRMARAWKEKKTVLLSGIEIDTIAYHFLSGYKNGDESFVFFDWMSRDFFEYIVDHKNEWDRIATDEKIVLEFYNSVRSDAKTAYELAEEATQNYLEIDIDTGRENWRKIYGEKYPKS